VADEDDRRAAIAQPAHDVEQPVRLLACQARIGFVEEEDMRVIGERACDLDQLALGGGKADAAGGEIRQLLVEAEAGEELFSLR
jgi:hypothetical protein